MCFLMSVVFFFNEQKQTIIEKLEDPTRIIQFNMAPLCLFV